uniref:Uncharacterized protein n=1 Tax=Megaselia scalaris TaxID=36166 RepID=T1GMP3_MEGSC
MLSQKAGPLYKRRPTMKFKYTSQNSTEWEDSIIFDSDDPDFVRSTEELYRTIVPSWNSIRPRTSSFTLRATF